MCVCARAGLVACLRACMEIEVSTCWLLNLVLTCSSLPVRQDAYRVPVSPAGQIVWATLSQLPLPTCHGKYLTNLFCSEPNS